MGSQTKTIGKAAIGGPWSLFNTNGRLVTDTDYRGKFQFVYFGFTRCPDICPNELVKIGKIFEKLESNPSLSGQIKPVFISIDPRRDTIDQLQEYSQDFHPSFDWLTGTPEQVNAVAKAYRVYWSKVDVTTDEDDDDEYSVDHTIVTYLMGPDGDFVDLFTSGVEQLPKVRTNWSWLLRHGAQNQTKERWPNHGVERTRLRQDVRQRKTVGGLRSQHLA